MALGIARKKPANEPADLAAAQATPGTSTSTGGATATRNTGAGAGKGADKGKSKGAGKETPNTFNITINSTGKSGDAVDGKNSAPEKKFNYVPKK
jgi:hypothetical protein